MIVSLGCKTTSSDQMFGYINSAIIALRVFLHLKFFVVSILVQKSFDITDVISDGEFLCLDEASFLVYGSFMENHQQFATASFCCFL